MFLLLARATGLSPVLLYRCGRRPGFSSSYLKVATDIRRCHVCESLWRWHHSRYRNTVADVFTRSSTLAYDDCWSSQTKSIFAHCEWGIKCSFMFHLMWLQPNHSCQIPCIFLYFSHNLAHFQKFIEVLYIIIKMSSVLLRTVEFQENSHLTFENLCNYVQLTISIPKLDKCVVKFSEMVYYFPFKQFGRI